MRGPVRVSSVYVNLGVRYYLYLRCEIRPDLPGTRIGRPTIGRQLLNRTVSIRVGGNAGNRSIFKATKQLRPTSILRGRAVAACWHICPCDGQTVLRGGYRSVQQQRVRRSQPTL